MCRGVYFSDCSPPGGGGDKNMSFHWFWLGKNEEKRKKGEGKGKWGGEGKREGKRGRGGMGKGEEGRGKGARVKGKGARGKWYKGRENPHKKILQSTKIQKFSLRLKGKTTKGQNGKKIFDVLFQG